jgi:hypothetical protein
VSLSWGSTLDPVTVQIQYCGTSKQSEEQHDHLAFIFPIRLIFECRKHLKAISTDRLRHHRVLIDCSPCLRPRPQKLQNLVTFQDGIPFTCVLFQFQACRGEALIRVLSKGDASDQLSPPVSTCQGIGLKSTWDQHQGQGARFSRTSFITRGEDIQTSDELEWSASKQASKQARTDRGPELGGGSLEMPFPSNFQNLRARQLNQLVMVIWSMTKGLLCFRKFAVAMAMRPRTVGTS